MKTKILIMIMALVLIVSCVFMSSCGMMTVANGGITEEEVKKLIDQSMLGDITVQGGENNNIVINSAKEDNVAAGKALLSVVSVDCLFDVYSSSIYTQKQQRSSGSGVIYKLDKEHGDAYVITNYHVVYNSNSVTQNGISKNINLYLYGQESEVYSIPATYVGGSMNYDLAVLKVNGSRVLAESNAMAADIADSLDVAVLDKAIAVGNPEDLGISATLGYINVDSEYITMEGADGRTVIQIRVMRMDTAVNSGNSGGGLFNNEGELIGIVNARLTDSENMGYAIPSSFVKYAADNILYYCDGQENESVMRCYLGITVGALKLYTEYNTENGKVLKREVIAVSAVENGGLADGVMEVGDIINSITVDGVKYDVTRMFVVTDSMLNARAGSSVVINVTRGNEDINLSIDITEDCIKTVK